MAKRAQFGGKLYPLIANALMGEVIAILQHEGIPNVIYTDDISPRARAVMPRWVRTAVNDALPGLSRSSLARASS